MNWVGFFILFYAIGALPSAYVAGRLLRRVDIRATGDRNAGAANAFHELGVKAGALVAAVDIGKGALVVLLARWLIGSETAVLLAGLTAIAGHNWPFFLQFRGGRGAATALGILLVLTPRAMIPLASIAAIPLFLYRSTNVFFAIAFAPLALAAWVAGAPNYQIGYSAALPVLVGLSHFLSLHRSMPGEERSAEEKTG